MERCSLWGEPIAFVPSVDTENARGETQTQSPLYKAASILTQGNTKTKNCTAHGFSERTQDNRRQVVQTIS